MPFSEFLGKSREQLDLLDSLKKKKTKKEVKKKSHYVCISNVVLILLNNKGKSVSDVLNLNHSAYH